MKIAPESIQCIQGSIFDDITANLADVEKMKKVTETVEDIILETAEGKTFTDSYDDAVSTLIKFYFESRYKGMQ